MFFQILKTDGFLSLYRGLNSALFGTVISCGGQIYLLASTAAYWFPSALTRAALQFSKKTGDKIIY
ncbi:MAG: hypothetical protein ACK55I_27905 [bacterium]